MRKILLTLVTLVGICLHVRAQGMTATLQSGENLSVFYGVDAFKEAYTAAVDGDQITLSAGTFNAPESNITKSVKITGTGAYEESANTIFETLTASGTDIRIEGVKFSKTLHVSGSSNLIVVRCWVETLNASSKFTNALFSQSVFKDVAALENAQSFTFMNCTISKFSKANSSTNLGLISNCVIYYYGWWGASANEKNAQPFAIYKNNVLGSYFYSRWLDNHNNIPCYSPSEYYNNVGFNINPGVEEAFYFDPTGCVNSNNQVMTYENLFNTKEVYPANPQNVPNGDDGTSVGPYGGSGFSQYPAIPRILSKSIDSKTNDEGKINVKIEVKAEN